MSLAIIILNYRTPKLAAECLASLAPCLKEVRGSRVVLVDNASGDDSVTQLETAIERLGLGDRVEFVETERNLGFAGGNNFAIGRLRAEDRMVLLLNSDTVFRPGVLKHCVGMLEANPRVGLMTCRLDNADGSAQVTARRLPTPARMTAHVLGLPFSFPKAFAWAELEDSRWDRRESREVEWVGGAFMLMRREVLDRVGVLDGRFFFYGEDAEFCHRIRRAGWRVFYDGSVAITHLGGGSSDPDRLARRAKDRLSWEARYLLQRSCYGVLAEYYLRGLDLMTYAMRCVKLAMTPSREADYRTHREILSVLLTRPRARGV